MVLLKDIYRGNEARKCQRASCDFASRALPLVKDVLQVGLIERMDAPYLACSPDVIGVLNGDSLPRYSNETDAVGPVTEPSCEPSSEINQGLENLVLAVVEIKTLVAPSTHRGISSLSRAEPVHCEFVDTTFRTYVPRIIWIKLYISWLFLESIMPFKSLPPRPAYCTRW